MLALVAAGRSVQIHADEHRFQKKKVCGAHPTWLIAVAMNKAKLIPNRDNEITFIVLFTFSAEFNVCNDLISPYPYEDFTIPFTIKSFKTNTSIEAPKITKKHRYEKIIDEE